MALPAQRSAQQRVGAYLLLERLGAGGLGEVWKARDPRLNRIVALKFLTTPRWGGVSARELMREARAASALNHANIVTIFEIGESDDTPYLAMEFVEGETLRSRLGRTPLPLDEALDIALQVAQGLAVAHRQGIIHRDLKPENVVLRVDGCVKLVDFGLAKQIRGMDAASTMPLLRPGVPKTPSGEVTAVDAGPSAATATGQIAGTLAYMSPEQARGQRITPASDVFSYGLMVYEMLTGQHPFAASSPMDMLSGILNKEPQPISARSAAVPVPVGEVVSRTLEKEPSRRFPSAVELAEALKSARGSAASQPAPSVVRHRPRWMQVTGGVLVAAVLGVSVWVAQPGGWFGDSGAVQTSPVSALAVLTFQVSGEDAAATFLAQSLADDLSVALARTGLRVASRSAVADAAGGDPRDLGARLGVDAVLTGTVRPLGNRYRIHVELVNTRTGFTVWSSTTTMDSSDVLVGEQKIAADLAGQLAEALAGK